MPNNFDTYKKLLKQFVAFKSISTDPKYIGEIDKTVAWLSGLLKANGFKTQIWPSKEANPVVFADYTVNPKLETILIYGHYDVQPAVKSDGWKGEPFSLVEDKQKLYARGIVDNKGQILIHIYTALELIKQKGLQYNVKFIIEGNEETGNPSLANLIRKNKKALACNVLIVSDGELTNNKPTIEVSLRGGFNCTLAYVTAKNSLHSGIFGGAVPNAAKELTAFLAKLINSDNSIAYKAFYKNVDKISPAELANNTRLSGEATDLAALAGVKKLVGAKGLDFYTQTGLTPTIQITGFKSGYIDEGYSNSVPSSAEVRLNVRTVAAQDSKEVLRDFEKFVRANTPNYVDYKLTAIGLHSPIKINLDNPYVTRVEAILKKVYQTDINRKNVGGSIPFVGDVKEVLGVDTLLIPLVNEDCSMHGANENFDINLVNKALEFSREFLGN